MLCFRDMTYCRADCLNDLCERNIVREHIDRKKIKSPLPTAWSDFSGDCPDYEPAPEAA